MVVFLRYFTLEEIVDQLTVSDIPGQYHYKIHRKSNNPTQASTIGNNGEEKFQQN